MRASRAHVLRRLRDHESRNVTFVARDGSWPMVWARAKGMHVWDVAGRRYLDFTAAFGVAAAGHANAAVVRAGRAQMGRLLHAMGDVHPHEPKATLARELSRLTFGRWGGGRGAGRGKVIFCNSGFEAVEAALKTARLATGRSEIVAFEGGYHGLGYGTLNATHRAHFRGPFLDQLTEFGRFVPFPVEAGDLGRVERALRREVAREAVGAILVEPVQVRGGIRVPPPGFLPLLRNVCDEIGAVLILDEIYTGFGRTGRWFAAEHEGVVPDVICLGKALTGGFPLSVCVGRADLMDAAWPASSGEAIHTSTFLGHPVGCAMALAQIVEIQRLGLVERAAQLGDWFLNQLRSIATSGTGLRGTPCRLVGSLAPPACKRSMKVGRAYARAVMEYGRVEARGLGLLAGLEIRDATGSPAGEEVMRLTKRLLGRGMIVLPEGEHGEVLGLTPPLIVSMVQLKQLLRALTEELGMPASRRGGRA